MIGKRKMSLPASFGLLLAACSSQGIEQSSREPAVEAKVGETLALPTEFRAEPESKLAAIGRPVVSVRPELRKVSTHDVDVTEMASSARKLPLDADTQEGSISLSTGKGTLSPAQGE